MTAYNITPAGQARLDDAMRLVGNDNGNWTAAFPYARRRADQLGDLGLIESVPLGTTAMGPGILISAARFYKELQDAFDAGRVGNNDPRYRTSEPIERDDYPDDMPDVFSDPDDRDLGMLKP